MKKFMFLSLALLFANSALTAEPRQVSHTLELSQPNKPAILDVSLYSGSINIIGYKGKQVIIDANIGELTKVNDDQHSDHYGQYGSQTKGRKKVTNIKGLKHVTNTSIQLEIEEEDNQVSIDSMSRHQKIELTVKVPFNSNLDLVLHRGEDIKIEKVYGSIEVMNARGAITATGIKGPIVAECARRDLTVVFDEFATNKPSSLNAHRGNIDVSLPKSSKVSVEVKSFQGEIYSGLKTEFKNTDKVQDDGDGKKIIIGDAMVAKLNGGSQRLMLNTFKGDIFVREKN